MGVAGGVVVVEHDDVGAGELLAVRLSPFRLFARLACAVSVTGGNKAPAAKVVDVFFSLGDRDAAAIRDPLLHLVDVVDDLGIDAFRASDPSAAPIRALKPKSRPAPR